MKRGFALILTLILLLSCLPAGALEINASSQRTTVLDLSNQSSAVSSSSEGWSYQPHGNGSDPLLVLNSYGSANAHSAPIKLPQNCTVEVNGTCYIDNAVVGEQYDLIAGAADGYLDIIGTGTLNLYADQYHGKGICISLGGNGKGNEDIMNISNVTINYYGMERDMYTAFYLEPAIYAYESMSLRNVTLNTYEGGYAIWMYGHTLIGASLTEATASTLEIEGCTINVENITGNNWQYAKGIYTTYGNIHIKDSNVVINAGSGSLYSYMTIILDTGAYVNINSTPVSTADYCSIVFCNRLKLLEGMEYFRATRTRYKEGDVLYCKETNSSVLGEGLTMVQGTFTDGTFAGAPDPANNNIPTIEVVGNSVPPTYHTVEFVDWDGTVLSTQQVLHGAAAVAPANPTREGYTFTGWSPSYSNVTTDLTITAQYTINYYTLKIYYRYENGSTAATAYSRSYAYGTAYSVVSPEVSGYTPNIEVVEGVMGAGNVSVVVTYTAIPQPTLLLGDVDCSGEVNFGDISALYLHLLGNGNVTAQGLLNADFDQSGTVDFGDISAIYLYLMGI